MNILDLRKKLFAVFAVASMVLAGIAKPLLWLLSGLSASSDSDGDYGVSSMGVDFYGNIHEGPISSFFTPELGDRD